MFNINYVGTEDDDSVAGEQDTGSGQPPPGK